MLDHKFTIMYQLFDSESTASQNRFAITQLKFKSECYTRQGEKPKLGLTPTMSVQNWNKNFIVRTQQRRKPRVNSNNELFGLLDEGVNEAKNNMFMAWKDRNHSQFRLTTANKFYADVVRSIKKSASERKLKEIPTHLESRRLTALPKQRPHLQVPAALMAQKLEWEEKTVRRINPTAQVKWPRVREIRAAEGAREKSTLMRISGWEYGAGEFDADGM